MPLPGKLGSASAYGLLVLICALLPVRPSFGAQTRRAVEKPPESKVDFSRDIRPILAANCFACHGQDATARQAGLRLDQREGAIGLRNGSRAIEPGKPERSPLVARVNATLAALRMPPEGSGRQLTSAQKRLLTLWVRQGAPYATHWAFRKLTCPPPPVIKNRAWVKSPIDAFVLARLEQTGLSPSPEADRYTLIRRLSLDLTGLPPTLDEMHQFVGDRSPDAYEKLVDRLLASPRYGEHWARMWLDLARYADTQGYEKDQPRTIWRYRDWVIDAFNADMPYDRFTVEQLAGDLLPNPTPSQLLATAFNRNTMTNTEGGVDQEEFRTAAIKDRIDTTVQVWMGLTMGCAKCHSHKYDPITHEDYYRFYALFNQTQDANYGDETPTAPMPTDEQQRRQTELQERRKGLQGAFWKQTPEIAVRQQAWERSLSVGGVWTPLHLEKAAADSGSRFHARPDGALLVSGPQSETDAYTLTFMLPPVAVTAVRLEALRDPSLPNGGPGRYSNDQNVVTSEFSVAYRAPGEAQQAPVPLQNPRADFQQNGWPVAGALDGDPGTGWAWSPENGKPHVALFDLKTPLPASGGTLMVTIRQNYPYLQHGCLRISVSGAAPGALKPELRSAAEIAAIPGARRSPEDQKVLDEAFREQDPEFAPIHRELVDAEAALTTLDAAIARIPIMRELPSDRLRVTHIHQRGNFLDPGAVVTPDVPAAFGPLPAAAPHNRLGAAQWLVSRDNPLTPRVAVNRFWARFFGTGLVETEEDFGTQGTPPTDPLLLDWLAATFRDRLGWSMKGLCKTIVMSATYRQSSQADPVRLKADLRNALLSRGPRYRLSAEMIRDQALAVAGLLSAKMHGPSVMPPQPPGVWRTVYSGLQWQTSPGEDRYRRALYTFWRRSSPYPAMTTFDAGSAETCVIRRVRTNTPLQALVTLNDPAFVEAAGGLGKAMLAETLPTPRARLVYGFRRALMRPPSEPEVNRLMRLYADALADFRTRPDAAKAVLVAANSAAAPGSTMNEQAAYTMVANVLLNLDETLTKP